MKYESIFCSVRDTLLTAVPFLGVRRQLGAATAATRNGSKTALPGRPRPLQPPYQPWERAA